MPLKLHLKNKLKNSLSDFKKNNERGQIFKC